MTTATKREPMDMGFAVFNLHINNAGPKADREFVRIFGQEKFDKYIQPLHDAGIMSMFGNSPGKYSLIWAAMVTVLVNEGCD